MKFLVDAQLPARLARDLTEEGHDALHTSQLPDGNRTTDEDIASLADADDRVVVSKDRDFRDAHLLRGTPRRVLVVATGNISNNELVGLFSEHLAVLVSSLGQAALVELRPGQLVVHDDE